MRDALELNACEIGLRALTTHPQRSMRKDAGDADLRVSIAGVAIYPGDWIYADVDGILISRDQL